MSSVQALPDRRAPTLSDLSRCVRAYVADAERHFDMDAAREHVARRGVQPEAVRGAIAAMVGGYVQEAQDAVVLEQAIRTDPLLVRRFWQEATSRGPRSEATVAWSIRRAARRHLCGQQPARAAARQVYGARRPREGRSARRRARRATARAGPGDGGPGEPPPPRLAVAPPPRAILTYGHLTAEQRGELTR